MADNKERRDAGEVLRAALRAQQEARARRDARTRELLQKGLEEKYGKRDERQGDR